MLKTSSDLLPPAAQLLHQQVALCLLLSCFQELLVPMFFFSQVERKITKISSLLDDSSWFMQLIFLWIHCEVFFSWWWFFISRTKHLKITDHLITAQKQTCRVGNTGLRCKSVVSFSGTQSPKPEWNVAEVSCLTSLQTLTQRVWR